MSREYEAELNRSEGAATDNQNANLAMLGEVNQTRFTRTDHNQQPPVDEAPSGTIGVEVGVTRITTAVDAMVMFQAGVRTATAHK
jgi:hypothetical protein